MADNTPGAPVVACRGNQLDGAVEALPVPWWSFTKACYAAAGPVLVERGKFDLDAPIAGQPFMLRQLLQRTSGLRCCARLRAYHEAVARGDPPWDEAALMLRSKLSNSCSLRGRAGPIRTSAIVSSAR